MNFVWPTWTTLRRVWIWHSLNGNLGGTGMTDLYNNKSVQIRLAMLCEDLSSNLFHLNARLAVHSSLFGDVMIRWMRLVYMEMPGRSGSYSILPYLTYLFALHFRDVPDVNWLQAWLDPVRSQPGCTKGNPKEKILMIAAMKRIG